MVAAALQQDSRVSAQATSELQQIILHPDVLSKLSDSISTAIIYGLNASTSVVETAQVVSVLTPHSLNESNCEIEPAVQGSVTGALTVLSGEACINTHLDKPEVLFNSVSVPIGAKVSANQILVHKYIDFRILLNSKPDDQSYQPPLSNNLGNNISTLSPEPKNKPRRINSLMQWTSVFQVFVGVYTSKFQTSAPALMKYGEIVRDLPLRGGDCRYYDENLRYLMQKHHSTLAWDAVHWELWLRAQIQDNSTSVGCNPTVAQSYPKGFCWRYHKGQFCGGCAFKHECFKCGAKQVASRCSFRSHAAKPAPLTSPSGSQSTNPGKVNKMILYFKGYNIPVAQFLLERFSQGFPLNYQGPRQSLFAANLKSPIDNPTAVDVKIPQEFNLD